MKTTIGIIVFMSLTFLYSCDCSDEEFSIAGQPYLGNELKINGYYYSYDTTSERTSIKFFYRNGIVLSGGSYYSRDLNNIEKEILEQIETIKNYKTTWEPFVVNNNTLIIESYYDNPPSCKLLTQRLSHDIQNDTTIVLKKTDHPGYKNEIYNEVWHFKHYSPKPDSTNIFIK